MTLSAPSAWATTLGTRLAVLRAKSSPRASLLLAQRCGLAQTSILEFEAGRLARASVSRLAAWSWFWGWPIETVLRGWDGDAPPPPVGWTSFYEAERELWEARAAVPRDPTRVNAARTAAIEAKAAHAAALTQFTNAVRYRCIYARAQTTLSQVHLARRIGNNASAVSRAERGNTELYLDYIERLAGVAGDEPESLILTSETLRLQSTVFHIPETA